jgi:YHS domain-containing protein
MFMKGQGKHSARLLGLAMLAIISISAETRPVLADGSVNTGYFGGVAIMGYDAVAYFTDGQAVKGSEEHSYEWLGTPWYFANEKHKEMFMREPVKYSPQYGGYCAGEVAGSGSVTVNIDPEAFKIIDGKLYLTYDKVDTDKFAANASDGIVKADANWPKERAKLALDNYN